ncbi:adenosine deaminase [Nocardioides scoriae]|uniref:Adenosine deaminase n=1 Tax=Nocardioides scoriae TaxID=642780 RepID=A0A1H1R9T4_9ACTN|nr:adenosine deaminase [Nocardioides scoriae]SDS32554.1 adenosine deaminase [Nocardioides scoriae]
MAEPTALTSDLIRSVPKVLLHDHLDGGLRPATVLELADEVGHPLPADDAGSLGRWFTESADSGSLPRYLETFDHTVAVMQRADHLARVARECVEDLADDGVVYAEVRYAPEQHLGGGLTLEEVVRAVQEGLDEGMAARAGGPGRPVVVRQLLTAMRHAARSREIAELAVAHRDDGVVGFDIAGAEAGYPPTRHLDAFEHMKRSNAHFTIHAGEAFGLPSIWEALQWCGADRLGHGVRLVDDIELGEAGVASAVDDVRLGRLASYVRDRRVPLELCPHSNVQTGAAASIAEHPIGLLARLRFRVTVNTDNRLMSGTSMTREMQALVDAFGWDLGDLRWVTVNAMKSAFAHFDQRLRLIEEVIKPGYAEAGLV